MSTELATNQQHSVPQTITPMDMLNIAIEKGADIDKLTQLMELNERWQANEARKAYVKAITEFKSNPPEILKSKHVEFTSQKGTTTAYDHATLDNVSDAIGKSLSKHGLAHSWNIEHLEGGQIKVTCILRHELGHSESVSMQAGLDQSGSKNNIQAAGSTVTYLQRYTLLAITGTAAKGMDDDGNQADQSLPRITESQAADIQSLIDEVQANKQQMLAYFSQTWKMKLESLGDIPAKGYAEVVKMLEQKRKQS